MRSGLGISIVCGIPGRVDALESELELELELEQFSEAVSMPDGAKGDIRSEVGMAIPVSVMGVKYPFWPVGALDVMTVELLLLLRVRGRPARRAGL
jgi:hypothetical protein